ncbi:hypothetical protein D3C80_651470 [compost metagenome]
MNNVKVVEVSVNEDGEVSVNVCGLGDYKWFNYMVMDGGLKRVIDESEIEGDYEEWLKGSKESGLIEDESVVVGIKEKMFEEVEKVVEELGGDVVFMSKLWSIEVDFSLSIVVGGFVE